MQYHYLDNASTTLVYREAANAAEEAMMQNFGNPSSLHRLGTISAKILNSARETMASCLGCTAEEFTFTSGGTEAVNMALMGAARKCRAKKRHIISTQVEHKAVLNTLKRLEADGYSVTLIAPEKDGTVSAEKVLAAVREDTGIISVMAVNNETGAVMPIVAIKKGLESIGSTAILHSDTVQALFKIDTPVSKLGADMVSVSGHKFGAMKGIGGIYIRKGLKINPFITGGGQESNMRSGTEPMPGICSMAKAAEIRMAALKDDILHVKALNDYLRKQLAENFPSAFVLSPENAVPHILCFSLPGSRSEVNVRILSDRNVFVSGGSACSKGKASYVLTAMNVPQTISSGALRVSMCPQNTREDIDALIEGLKEVSNTFNLQ